MKIILLLGVRVGERGGEREERAREKGRDGERRAREDTVMICS